MTTKTTPTFDELVKRYYGGANRRDLSNTVRVKELLDSYYGKPYSRRKPKRPPATVLSLSHDDGEMPPQHKKPHRFEEYVAQYSTSEAEFVEYVVERGDASAQSPPMPTAGETIPADKVKAYQENQVDVLQPLKQPATDAAETPPSEAGSSPTKPVAAQKPAGIDTASKVPTSAQTMDTEVTPDDFFADMQSILSGEKLFDPKKRTLVNANPEERAQPASIQSDDGGLPMPDASNSQAIFDKIAKSMQYANAYDLGTLELSNRFADFDKIADMQERAAEKARSQKLPAATEQPPAELKVDKADFIQDLDSIKGIVASGSAPTQEPAPPAPNSQAMEYSRPFYDAGEHVLTAEGIYGEQFRVGKNPGVLFSYGQIIAMAADLYESVDKMMNTDVEELQKVKALLVRSTAYYKGGKANRSLDVSNKDWDEVTKEQYLKLAENNYEHFSPDLLIHAPDIARSPNRYGTNKSAWEMHHKRAIEEAQKMFLRGGEQNSTQLKEWPLIINAFGDHFLTDAFAAGHLINKEAMIREFKINFYSGDLLKVVAEEFYARVARLAWKGEVKKKFSVLETYEPYDSWWNVFNWNPNIDTENAFRKMLLEIAVQRPDAVANLAVKALHDRLNKDGVEVTNNAGDGTWMLTGDGTLNAANIRIIKKAVQQSIDNINDPSINASNLDFDIYYQKVWKNTPQPTAASHTRLAALLAEYTNPESETLRQAAADIIYGQVDSLIKRLVKEKKLKYA